MFVFVPLVMLCNAQPRQHLPVAFPHDYQYIIIMVAFSLTSGYLASMSSLIVPKLVPAEKLEDAFHVNILLIGIFEGIISFTGFVSVDLL
jgi:equilibrative nucleoside transporter 1/2/3